MSHLPPNPRPIEPRLAPRFHALLRQYPPAADVPRTQQRAEAMVADAVQRGASDIHIEPSRTDTRIRFRVDGVLHDVASVPGFSGHRLAAFFKVLAQIDATTLARPEQGHGRLDIEGVPVELRTTVAPTPCGEMAGLRLVNPQRPLKLLDDLGMAEPARQVLRSWLEGRQGMLLVGGPVGSGKTSTLYALLHELQRLPRSIITVEDPVESSLDGITQIEVNARRGLNFPEAIRAMLRLDPDYLLVGEIRDAESAHVAITAAGSGHALLSTIHARDAAGVVTALRNAGVRNWEIAAALEVSVSQRLVRRLCLRCREASAPADDEARWLEKLGATVPEQLFRPRGCDHCAGTGFDGRVGVFELWRLDAEAHRLIVSGADDLALARHAAQTGARPLMFDALEKLSAGVTALTELRPLGMEWMHPAPPKTRLMS